MTRLREAYFYNAAIYYLQRFSASEAHLKRVLQRKVMRAAHRGDEVPPECDVWIDKAVEKCVALGFVNDKIYAETLVQNLRRAGKARAVIAGTLKQKGVGDALAREVLGPGDEEVELAAALRHVQRKRLGRATDPALRQKDLAKLLRAGFSLKVAKQALAGEAAD